MTHKSAFLNPLPWQKIKVKQGPKSAAMHDVLKAAIQSLKEVNPIYLQDAKERHARIYDRVKTVFGGELALNNNGYATFARAMGTCLIQN